MAASPPSNALAEPPRGEGRGTTTFSDGGGEKFPVTVTLTQCEIMLAAMIGGIMHARALARGWKDRVYESDWNVHVEGIAAEIAVAKALGIRYRPKLDGFWVPMSSISTSGGQFIKTARSSFALGIPTGSMS
jgi:hypothetical protein